MCSVWIIIQLHTILPFTSAYAQSLFRADPTRVTNHKSVVMLKSSTVTGWMQCSRDDLALGKSNAPWKMSKLIYYDYLLLSCVVVLNHTCLNQNINEQTRRSRGSRRRRRRRCCCFKPESALSERFYIGSSWGPQQFIISDTLRCHYVMEILS